MRLDVVRADVVDQPRQLGLTLGGGKVLAALGCKVALQIGFELTVVKQLPVLGCIVPKGLSLEITARKTTPAVFGYLDQCRAAYSSRNR